MSVNSDYNPDHAVIILASGLSRRLGQSKQLLKQNGKPLIEVMTQLAINTNPIQTVIVVPSRDSTENIQIRQSLNNISNLSISSSIKIVANPTPQTGMANSLSLGIDALAIHDDEITLSHHRFIKRVLIMSIDQILLDENHLKRLLETHQKDAMLDVVASRYPSIDTPIVANNQMTNHADKGTGENKQISGMPITGMTVIGMPICISHNLLQQAQNRLEGDKGLRQLIRSMPEDKLLTINNPKLSYDIDTPQQLAYARAQSWLDDC